MVLRWSLSLGERLHCEEKVRRACSHWCSSAVTLHRRQLSEIGSQCCRWLGNRHVGDEWWHMIGFRREGSRGGRRFPLFTDTKACTSVKTLLPPVFLHENWPWGTRCELLWFCMIVNIVWVCLMQANVHRKCLCAMCVPSCLLKHTKA